MPRVSYRSAPLPDELFEKWTDLAVKYGYGQRGRIAFLRVLLEIAEAHPSLFRKR